MTKVKIAILDDYAGAALTLADWSPVTRQAEVRVFTRHLSDEEIVSALEPFEVICTLRDPSVPALAAHLGNTRSAAALDLWGDRLAGAVVAIGNAPTALFRLLELVAAGGPRPAAVLGIPVGFIGAAESKDALAASDLEHLIVRGRRGGSAITAAAVNALASEEE